MKPTAGRAVRRAVAEAHRRRVSRGVLASDVLLVARRRRQRHANLRHGVVPRRRRCIPVRRWRRLVVLRGVVLAGLLFGFVERVVTVRTGLKRSLRRRRPHGWVLVVDHSLSRRGDVHRVRRRRRSREATRIDGSRRAVRRLHMSFWLGGVTVWPLLLCGVLFFFLPAEEGSGDVLAQGSLHDAKRLTSVTGHMQTNVTSSRGKRPCVFFFSCTSQLLRNGP